MKMYKYALWMTVVLSATVQLSAQKIEPIPFGDMDNWLVRKIKESALLGGNTQYVYAVAPSDTVKGNEAYVPKESPWGSSNVMANVMGVIKTSTTVFPEKRGNGYCARMETKLVSCKVLGMFNIKVLASGTIFLGQMDEPIRNTNNPQSKMISGIPFTKRPTALMLDYKASPAEKMIKATGFSKIQNLDGRDSAEVCVYLQKRWEDEQGNIHAKRIATAYYKFGQASNGWVNEFKIPFLYGDITQHPDYKPYMCLVPENDPKYTRNSKGEMVPIHEEAWGDAQDEPTHIILRISAGDKGAYIGSPDSKLWVDNVKFVY